ncbi:hypothetical protein PM082_009351 [Marasmius tenuissimus]|nr:hypothetical protein PM082_009351 [Marasmius tenuissimus]
MSVGVRRVVVCPRHLAGYRNWAELGIGSIRLNIAPAIIYNSVALHEKERESRSWVFVWCPNIYREVKSKMTNLCQTTELVEVISRPRLEESLGARGESERNIHVRRLM